MGSRKEKIHWRVSLNEVDYIVPLLHTNLYKRICAKDLMKKNILKSLDYERMDTDNGYFSKDKYVLENSELVNLKNIF